MCVCVISLPVFLVSSPPPALLNEMRRWLAFGAVYIYVFTSLCMLCICNLYICMHICISKTSLPFAFFQISTSGASERNARRWLAFGAVYIYVYSPVYVCYAYVIYVYMYVCISKTSLPFAFVQLSTSGVTQWDAKGRLAFGAVYVYLFFQLFVYLIYAG